MRFVDLIETKKRGRSLAPEQIRWAIAEYVADRVPDYQMAALLMAIRWRGLDDEEVVALTEAMVASGERFDLSGFDRPVVDKHSTGGVGDKVSLILAPLVAACGCVVPMVSGRGLGHTGGTLDKLESIPGFRTDLDADAFVAQLRRIGVAMGAQTERFVPADRRLYALRDVTATVDDTGLITASILSKKIAEGTRALVLDVKDGSGAFFASLAQARRLADRLLAVARRAGLECTALLTSMDAPLGRAVGNALEVREAIACLAGGGPGDLRRIVLALAEQMLLLGGACPSAQEARRHAREALDGGAARARFEQLIRAQGGDARVVADPDLLPRAAASEALASPAEGVVAAIDALAVGRAAIALRAGRDRKEDTIDPGAGIVLEVGVGDPVGRGQPWATIHYGPDADVATATRLLTSALRVTPQPPPPTPLILERRP